MITHWWLHTSNNNLDQHFYKNPNTLELWFRCASPSGVRAKPIALEQWLRDTVALRLKDGSVDLTTCEHETIAEALAHSD